MSLGPGQLLLLDTCVVVHLARNDRTGQYVEQTHALTTRADRPLISTVTEGEILGLAAYWNWGPQKKQALRDLLAEFVRVEAGLPQVVETYAELFEQVRRQRHPTGENDLWIAATTRATGSVLLTGDQGYNWMHPALVNVILVPSVPPGGSGAAGT